LLEQADLSFLYPLNARWSLVGRYYYSLQDKEPLEIIGGVQWDSCCLADGAQALQDELHLDGVVHLAFAIADIAAADHTHGQA
ncbi:hypothetical protein, partial [Escherichia coli]|uniref:hypothetical protein n=1 Tax=Escherichia coli TaxID=562 RepID=UPI003BA22F19